jgi:SsrA-binding protein
VLILVDFSVKFETKKIDGMADSEQRVVVSNRRARHEYEILETVEAGIALKGTEVKSLRSGNANLQDGYAVIKKGEVWLLGMHISPYEQGNINNHEPKRDRRLLLQKKQIRKFFGRVAEKGLTLVPLSVYFKGPYAKIELALARGKKTFDKREAVAKRDAQREVAKRLKRSSS